MTGLGRRFVVFSLGAAICLLVLEIALRIVGVYYVNLSEFDNKQAPDAEITILSIGDSVTFGIGAEQGMSYPDQLEKLLNESGNGHKYTVINRGRPAQNTAQLLTRLEGQLKDFHPDIVTILIGAQNQANYFGYQDYLARQQRKNKNLTYRLHNIFDHIRIYKFIRLLIRQKNIAAGTLPHKTMEPKFMGSNKMMLSKPDSGISRKLGPQELANLSPEELADLSPEELADYPGPGPGPTPPPMFANDAVENGPESMPTAPNMYPNDSKENTPECVTGVMYKLNGDYEKALSTILGVMAEQDVESQCYNVAGAIYSDQGDCDNAIKMFEKGIKRDPGQYRNYEGIGECYRMQGDLEKAIEWFEKGFAAARFETLYELCYVGISDSYKDSKQYERAANFFSKEMKREPVVKDYLHSLAGDYYAMFKDYGKDEDVHDWIRADIEEILELCARYNAEPVLQNYPTEAPLAGLYKDIAKKNLVLFVDQHSAFKPYISDGKLDDEYFVPDGHPNEKGYHIMAENILKTLKQKPQLLRAEDK